MADQFTTPPQGNSSQIPPQQNPPQQNSQPKQPQQQSFQGAPPQQIPPQPISQQGDVVGVPLPGFSPAGSQMPGAAGTGQPLPPPPPSKPSKPANFQLGAMLSPMLKIKVPPHTLKFDEQYFLHLLAGSISLTKDEKIRIVESIPKLKQSQVDELIKIFEEERRKFAELGDEHVPQLEKLARQHYEDWVDIELKQEQGAKAASDAKQAEELRKQFGL